MTDWKNELSEAMDRITKRAMEAATAVIRKDGPTNTPYCVYSEKTGRKFGCYKTKEGAEKRLKQIEMFKHIKGEENNGD